MPKDLHVILLSEADSQVDENIHYFDVVKLNEKRSIIEVLKVGTIHDRGLKITESMLEEFVVNFNEGVYGTEIQVNLGHVREGEAAGWVKKLIKEGDRLLAEVEWTPLGIDKIQSKQYKFTSSELAMEYKEPKGGKVVKNVFIGVALTNVPAVKGMAPVTLSEQANLFLNNLNTMDKVKKMYDKLMGKDSVTEEELAEFKKVAKDSDDQEGVGKMTAALAKKTKKLSEGGGEGDEDTKGGDEDKKDEVVEEKADEALTEQLTTLTEQLAQEKKARVELQEKIERKELSETLNEKFVISDKCKVGVKKADLAELLNLLMGETSKQRAKWMEFLSAKVCHVDLSVIGGEGEDAVTEKEEEKALDEKAKELSEKTGRPLHECLADLYRDLAEAKK